MNTEFKGYKFWNQLCIKVIGATRLDDITKEMNMDRAEDPN